MNLYGIKVKTKKFKKNLKRKHPKSPMVKNKKMTIKFSTSPIGTKSKMARLKSKAKNKANHQDGQAVRLFHKSKLKSQPMTKAFGIQEMIKKRRKNQLREMVETNPKKMMNKINSNLIR
jgi:hypothetical protein